jgi:hypothetical protein
MRGGIAEDRGIFTHMTRSGTSNLKDAEETKLARWDWIVLPLIVLVTVCLIVGSWRTVAGRMFRVSTSTTLGCLILKDATTGVRAIPNTVCSQKIYESQLVEYRFNSCGHRAGMECGPKPPGVYRIVMVGSSFNFGMWVPREKSFAALLPAQLSQQTGRKVELYNEAMQWGFPASAALRFHQVFAEQPDLILWVLTPTDVANASLIVPFVPSANPPEKAAARESNLDHVKSAFAQNSFPNAIAFIWNRAVVSAWDRKIADFRSSPSGMLFQHVLYASQSLYLKSYLTVPDSEGGFLKAAPSSEWQGNLQQFDKDAVQIEAQAKAAGVPFVAVLVPERAQAAMLSMSETPAGYAPYKLDDNLRSIIVRHGGTYLDILPDFRAIPNPENGYYPVDGHPDIHGHAMISAMLARQLTSGAVPALRTADAKSSKEGN